MESTTINNDISAIKEVREPFNASRSNLNHEEINWIREKLYNFLKEKEKKGSLTSKQEKSLKNLKKYLKKYSKRFRP